LNNQNRRTSSFQYGFTVRNGTVTIDYDPAVRNIGNPWIQINPLFLVALGGAAVGALIVLVTFAALRLPGLP
jgi:hypothetical protein